MTDDGRTRRQFFAGTGTAAAIGLAGCTGALDLGQTGGDTTGSGGDGGANAHGAGIDGPSAGATVSMTTSDGSHFEPDVAWVEQGGSVTWKLESGSHTTTAYAEKADKPQRIPNSANAWDSGTLSEQGTTFEHTFETIGIYDYFCAPHEATGMVGTVIVGDPGPTNRAALQPPQDSLPSKASKKIESLNERVTAALTDTDESG